ncbi:PucR family transcriptional regulator [Burkholderia stagnalis]|uniref:Polyketide synthase regulator n=1 Tax=Burkholderia stagnalis TaxID=1503054 RepID=A0A119WW67_9BURK|nr:helix-turn-helix domain-containing protein [Burkholderia stagnalis]AOK52343.1 polyketide synthase regulator [Burkholderia stagnalis]KVN72827.1 polyketide synthase regulator [Burkholderia stagnalis]KVZ17406.1 polyketide synthase regulator [Burkholderia stagnalis]KWA50128.1 polyketide synthase regulator [Burkholderia stagnalis]KWA52773.1 polyketide synthase regulator [Burkholderia stagnalis]
MSQNSIPAGWRTWPLPSPRIQELMRRGAEIVLNVHPVWLQELDQVNVAAGQVMSDPVIAAAVRRINRNGLIHWATANIENPGAPVSRYLSPDMQSSARELVRRDLTDLVFASARSSQSILWQHWMELAFTLTADPDELHALLAVSSRSIAAAIDANMEVMAEFLRVEREAYVRGTHADRRELVTFIVEGTAIDAQEASRRLGYSLDQPHHAAIIWIEEAEAESGLLEQAAEALARCADTRSMLVVVANTATQWVWTHGGEPINMESLRRMIKALPGVHMTVATAGRGIEGFRRGHLDALATQRLLGRLHTGAGVVHADSMSLIALMTQHIESVQQFVAHTLGELATADKSLRQALRVFLAEGCNATEAAEKAHVHRNTLLRRLERAESLLPRPLAQQRLHVAAALEVLYWTAGDYE